jgi:hypothetical protein
MFGFLPSQHPSTISRSVAWLGDASNKFEHRRASSFVRDSRYIRFNLDTKSIGIVQCRIMYVTLSYKLCDTVVYSLWYCSISYVTEEDTYVTLVYILCETAEYPMWHSSTSYVTMEYIQCDTWVYPMWHSRRSSRHACSAYPEQTDSLSLSRIDDGGTISSYIPKPWQ